MINGVGDASAEGPSVMPSLAVAVASSSPARPRPSGSPPTEAPKQGDSRPFATDLGEGAAVPPSSPPSSLREDLSRSFHIGRGTAGGRGLLGALTAFAARLFGQQQKPTEDSAQHMQATAMLAYMQADRLSPSLSSGQPRLLLSTGAAAPLTSGRFIDLNV